MAASAPTTGAGALPDTQNKAWATNKSAFGYRMMEKMGWAAGKGLGKKEDGMVAHVKVKKRADAQALGADLDATGNESLLGAVQDFNALLAKLSGSSAAGSAAPAASTRSGAARRRAASESSSDSDSSGSDSSSDSSDSEAPVQRKGRSSAGAGGPPPAKRNRAASNVSSESDSSDSSASSDSDSDSDASSSSSGGDSRGRGSKGSSRGKVVLGGKAPAPAPATAPAGRVVSKIRQNYHKNLRNKNVGNYGKADLAAILGHRA